ncbi:glucosidase II beta subunit-like-domain-containing protein [Naematelia encephala]|uniref:Glucosidase 2 subunit beta n=1 Tax=Naematelia encephala TaxID=71784 RepID=A0A1Y2AYL6_9TREE|nr:glucosidase II beta subunit-like-domain-containing protein [Naematelia encephala]
MLTLTTVLLSTLLHLTAQAESAKPVTPAQIRGLNPSLFSHYEPNPSHTFTCLDGSRTINYSAINDDYCDCPDGSDEPGTAACGNGIFWCANEGHVPGTVLSSRVNDGLCDPECCDGSDEWATGACSDTCAEIGKEYRKKIEAELKTRKTGAKIRSTYVKWALGERTRLEKELEQKRQEVLVKEKEAQEARVALDRVESQSAEIIEKRKQSPLYTSLLTHRLALTRLRSRTSRLEKELDVLHSILEDLSKGYNPNYQDMAVKAAVVGYEELTKVPEGEPHPAEEGTEEEIEDKELDELENRDLEGLLLADMGDEGGDELNEGLLWKIDEYIPDSLYEYWSAVRDTAIDWLIKTGLIGKSVGGSTKGGTDAPHVAAARQRHTDLTNALSQLNREVSSTSETLGKMKDQYGPDAEWKKLDGTCIEKGAGGYVYELCFFGRVNQKSPGGPTTHLGTFTEWNKSAPPGSYEYFTRQKYLNGAKCWNGPMRSATIDIQCGTTNEILSISEPEKCEYHLKATSPALCWPLDGSSSTGSAEVPVKEEL